MKRRDKIIGVIIIAFIVINFVPTSYSIFSPGIAQELSSIIKVEDGYKGKTDGDFLLTAIASQRATVWEFIYISIARPEGRELVPLREQLPPGIDMIEYLEIVKEHMEISKLKAQAVAFKNAGYDVRVLELGAEVVKVLDNGSANGKLQEGDIIIKIDKEKVKNSNKAVTLIQRHEIGETVDLTFIRDDNKIEIELKTMELGYNSGQPAIGVQIVNKLDYKFPRNVTFETENIAGSSAGIMFALEIYNQLISDDITKGRRIAGTGTIDLDGNVGEIDGVFQKVLAAQEVNADLFIVPAANYEEARNTAENIDIVAVEKFAEVVDFLAN